MIISGSEDGYVKVWNIKKELIREIKFPEPVYSVSFLNNEGDIIVGHLGKLSTVSHTDYKPQEISKLFAPKPAELEMFYAKKSVKVDEDVYLNLKKKDDEIKKQNIIAKSPTKPKIKFGSVSP